MPRGTKRERERVREEERVGEKETERERDRGMEGGRERDREGEKAPPSSRALTAVHPPATRSELFTPFWPSIDFP